MSVASSSLSLTSWSSCMLSAVATIPVRGGGKVHIRATPSRPALNSDISRWRDVRIVLTPDEETRDTFTISLDSLPSSCPRTMMWMLFLAWARWLTET